jgi:hypothetical protein
MMLTIQRKRGVDTKGLVPIATIAIMLITLSACAPIELADNGESASPAPIDATTEPANLSWNFEDVIMDSCAKAMAEGVVEVSASGDYRQVMVPKDTGIGGYSAAWQDLTTGEVGLIWEAGAFLSCSAALTLSLAEEEGFEPSWEVSEWESGYLIFEDFGEYGSQTIRLTVSEGLIITAGLEGGEPLSIIYGASAADYEIIELAVERFEQ